jgi:prepilin-type N-terminal cleavage/methylation domain-containing protein
MMKKLFKAEGGFTLVELLVTIAILAVLFGVVTLSLGGIGSDAESTVNNAELGVVQSAIDIYLAEYNTDTVNAFDDGSGAPACLDSDPELGTQDGSAVNLSRYLRDVDSNCKYEWGADGAVSQGTCDCN